MPEFSDAPSPGLLDGVLTDLPPMTALLLLAMIVLAGIIVLRVVARIIGLTGREPLNEESPWTAHHKDALDD